MENSQNSNIKITFLIAAIILVIFSIQSYIRFNNLIRESEFVDHAHIVKVTLHNISIYLTEAESHNRGYMLTNDASFLHAYHVATSSLNYQLNQLDSLSKDITTQRLNVIKLRSAINERVRMLQHHLTLFNTSVISVQNRLKEKELMENVQGQILEMKNQEDKLLSIHSASLKKSTLIATLFTVFLILISIIILFASYYKILHGLKIRAGLKSEIVSKDIKIQNILQYAPDAIISIDEDGKIMSWNPQAESIFGWKEEEVIGKTLTETIIPERYRDQHNNGLNHFLKTGEGTVINKAIEVFALNKNQNEFPVELKISAAYIDNRYVFIGFVRDISLRQQIIEELKNTNNRLKEAQEMAHIGSWEWDVLTNKVEWSEELYRIFGLTPYEFKADYDSYIECVHPDDREFVNGIIQQAFKDHQPYYFFHKLIRPNGDVRIIDSTGKVYTDSNGNTIKMSGTAQDITTQKEYEAELKESEERFLKIFDHSPVPMTIAEIKTGNIKYANRLFYETFGYSEDEVIGSSTEKLNLMAPEESQRVGAVLLEFLMESRSIEELKLLTPEETEEILRKLKQTDAMKKLVITYTRKNGETFPAVVNFEIIEFGIQHYTIASYQDVTERKKAKELLSKQNEELQKINKELESFNYITSHDLQEPLRQIQNFASRIITDDQQNLSERGKIYFEKMNNAANRMQTLISDLLAYSRTATEERRFETTDLNVIIEQVKSDFQEVINEKNATIELAEMRQVNVIPFQFRQMMYNLIGNSLKFAKPDVPPHIVIKYRQVRAEEVHDAVLAPDTEYCHISVTDNGIGFEPQYKDRIFEVFQRLHDRQKIAGTGIGLSIVKKIVENHNGVITTKSEVNEGTTFDIYIPINQNI